MLFCDCTACAELHLAESTRPVVWPALIAGWNALSVSAGDEGYSTFSDDRRGRETFRQYCHQKRIQVSRSIRIRHLDNT